MFYTKQHVFYTLFEVLKKDNTKFQLFYNVYLNFYETDRN